MANKNAARLLYVGLLGVLSAPFCGGQVTAIPVNANIMLQATPNPPKVTCKGDQLTVLADNSTLESVLAAIHACTGVQIDIPEGAAAARSFDQLGPGPARQVLTALLNGTDFNYVIESSATDPQKVEAVLLLSRANDKPTAAVQERAALTPARRAWLLTQKNGRAVYNGSQDASSTTDSQSESPASDDTPAASNDIPGANATPAPPAAQTPPAADAAAPPAPAAPEPPAGATANPTTDKVSEDKITNMQQLFEQRRQMIESQGSPAKPQ